MSWLSQSRERPWERLRVHCSGRMGARSQDWAFPSLFDHVHALILPLGPDFCPTSLYHPVSLHRREKGAWRSGWALRFLTRGWSGTGVGSPGQCSGSQAVGDQGVFGQGCPRSGHPSAHAVRPRPDSSRRCARRSRPAARGWGGGRCPWCWSAASLRLAPHPQSLKDQPTLKGGRIIITLRSAA